MNKILHILLVLLFSLTITSCGSDDGGSSASTTTSDDDTTTSDNTTTTSTTAIFGTSLFDSSYFGD